MVNIMEFVWSMLSKSWDGLTSLFERGTLDVLLGFILLTYFVVAMLPNNERFREWFNKNQNEDPIRFFPITIIVLAAPLPMGVLAAILALRLSGENEGVALFMLGVTALTFVGQRLYAIKFVP